MSGLEIDDDLVRHLAALLEETGLSEIEYAIGDKRVRVARNNATPSPVSHAGDQPQEAPAANEPEIVHRSIVTAPMVGTVFAAPEPGAEPFVKIGDSVDEGQTLFLIEAMKTYNPIRAPCTGTVSRILVTDGSPVEYGEELLFLD